MYKFRLKSFYRAVSETIPNLSVASFASRHWYIYICSKQAQKPTACATLQMRYSHPRVRSRIFIPLKILYGYDNVSYDILKMEAISQSDYAVSHPAIQPCELLSKGERVTINELCTML